MKIKDIEINKIYTVRRGVFKGDRLKVVSIGDIMCKNLNRWSVYDKPTPWKADELKPFKQKRSKK